MEYSIIESIHHEWTILFNEGIITALFVSALCGSIVGLEREKAEKPAGLRTNMFICVGSCLFTLASILSWKYISGEPATVDPARIAAQVVSGIGFLGAGVILKTKTGDVVGITTAATIWLVAAIGVVIGIGFPLLGFLVATTTAIALFFLGKIELSEWFSFSSKLDDEDSSK